MLLQRGGEGNAVVAGEAKKKNDGLMEKFKRMIQWLFFLSFPFYVCRLPDVISLSRTVLGHLRQE